MTYTIKDPGYIGWYSDYEIEYVKAGAFPDGYAFNSIVFSGKGDPQFEAGPIDRVLMTCFTNPEKSDIKLIVQKGTGKDARFGCVYQSRVIANQ